MQDLTVEIAPYITEYAPKIAEAITKYAPTIANGMSEYLPPILTALGNLLKTIGKLIDFELKWFGFWGQVLGKFGFDVGNIGEKFGLKKRFNPYEGAKYDPKHFSDNINPPAIQFTPNPAVSNLNNAINIVNNISGSNAAEIAQKTTNSTKSVIEDMMFNRFQASNVTGK